MKSNLGVTIIGVAITCGCTSNNFGEPVHKNLLKAEHGWVVASQDHIAMIAKREGSAALRASERYFAVRPAPFIIVDADLAIDQSKLGNSRSYSWVFKDELAQTDYAFGHNTTLRHEIGHDVFIRSIYPDSRGSQYGGDAPDWLDEAAAILFEGKKKTDAHRFFARRAVENEELIPISEFVQMTHPQWPPEAPAAAAHGNNQSGRVVSLSALGNARQTQIFYSQCRAFADYLINRSANEKILLKIAEHMREGGTFEAWLENQANVPADLKVLQTDFFNWVATDPTFEIPLR